MKTDVKKIFGSNVFNDAVMKERLPKAAYKKLKKLQLKQAQNLILK